MLKHTPTIRNFLHVLELTSRKHWPPPKQHLLHAFAINLVRSHLTNVKLTFNKCILMMRENSLHTCKQRLPLPFRPMTFGSLPDFVRDTYEHNYRPVILPCCTLFTSVLIEHVLLYQDLITQAPKCIFSLFPFQTDLMTG